MPQNGDLNVYRNDGLVGVLSMADGEPFYGFTYDDAFLAAQDAMPLSASLPLSPELYPGARALPFFEGLLPEGDARLVVARQFHVSPHSPASLIRVLGRDCAGDVMVVEKDDPVQPPACDRYIRMPRGLAGIAQDPLREIAQLRSEYRLSLAGAQEKIALYHDDCASLDDGWYAPADGSPSTHIVKPQIGERFPCLAVNEYVCMTAASFLGIEAAEVDLLYPATPLLVAKRYDRVCSGKLGETGMRLVDRLHQEDVCQALGLDSSAKYENAKTDYLVQVVELVVHHAETPARTLHDLYRLMLFNYLIGNCDAHLKNYSLLWTGGESVRLAPAYDLVATALYDGRYGAKLTRSMGLRMGDHLNIDKVNATDVSMFAQTLRQPLRVAKEVGLELMNGLEEALCKAAELAVSSGFGEDARDVVPRIIASAKPRLAVLQDFVAGS